MNKEYFCAKLNQRIELSNERLGHIFERHPELQILSNELDFTIRNPELILLKSSGEILLIRWFQHVLNGKFITAVVLRSDDSERKWVVTAFVTRKLPKGELYE